MTTPKIKVVELELTDLPATFGELEGIDTVHCLVRFRRRPIAWWDLAVINGQVDIRTVLQRKYVTLVYPIFSELLKARLLGQLRDSSFEKIFQQPNSPAGESASLTVAVCTRNRTNDLRRCLDSLVKMQAHNIEVLVVDNAPDTNETMNLVTNEFPDFRYLREDRPGLDWARNKALAEASNELIAYTDDDVVVDSDWATAITRTFGECPDAIALTGLVVPFELETKAQQDFEAYGGFDRGFTRRWTSVMQDDPNHVRPWGTGQFGTGANMAFRTATLRELGGFDPALDVGTVTNGGGDLEMLFRVLRSGGTLVYEPEAMVRHRHRRDYDVLRTQIRNNGIGLVSFFQRTWIAYPGERMRLLQLCRWLLHHWHLKRYIRTFGSGTDAPRELILAEVRGFFAGFGKYKKARAEAIRLGGANGVAEKTRAHATQPVSTVPVGQSPMAVINISINEGIPHTIDTSGSRRTRINIFADGHYLGETEIRNHGRKLCRLEVVDRLVAQFGVRLLDTGRIIEDDALWANAVDATARFLDVGADPEPAVASNLPDAVSVSIVLATLDRPEALKRCLEAVTKQETNRQVEIIVVDNNPESCLTPPIVAAFPQVRLLSQKIKGLSYARNTGVVAARNEIIVSIDDDVVVPSDWLEKLVRPFAMSNVGAVTGNVLPLQLDSRAAVLFERYGGLGRGSRPRVVGRSWMNQFKGHPVPTWRLGATANAAFRADVFSSSEIGLFHEALGAGSPTGCSEDTLVFYNILASGMKIAYEPNAWVWHEHRSSMKALRQQLYNYSKGHVAYHLLVFHKHRDWRSLGQLFFFLPIWRLRQIVRHVRKKMRGVEPDFPLSLVFLEWLGNLVGPFSLVRSLWRVRKNGRVSGTGIADKSAPGSINRKVS